MNFVVFSDDWGRHPSSCEHLFRVLVKEHRVIWVNTIGYRNPSFSLYDIKRSFAKIGSWFSKPEATDNREKNPNLQVLSPVIVPFNSIGLVRRFNRVMVRRAIRKALEDWSGEGFVALSSLPNVADFFRDLAARFKVYYCVDDFTLFPGVDAAMIQAMEDELVEVSDTVLYTANYLRQKFENSGKPLHYFPHGVDFDHFHRKDDRRQITGGAPVLGFFGYLSEWVDSELIAQIALAHPDWRVVLIGGSDQSLERLKRIDNIELTGAVKYDKLVEAASKFDVGLIPFKINELTKAVNPLKFLEYMAMGLPVVSTPLPELQKHGDDIYLADTSGEFIVQITKALADDSTERRTERIAHAADNSWRARAEQLLQLVGDQAST